MTFQEQLNLYIEELSCSGRELAKNSGISETILSRYRKGERIPGADSDYLKKLAAGIALTAEQKGKKIDQERALEALLAALKQEEKTEIFYYQKFDILLRELEIPVLSEGDSEQGLLPSPLHLRSGGNDRGLH